MSDLQNALKKSQDQIGTEIGVSNWITVDQDMIDTFAKTTQDEQWIHVDPVRAAAESPFGGPIAHGFLTLSLASRFAYDCIPFLPGQVMGVNYGMNMLRFLKPVGAGSRVRGRFVLKDIKTRTKTDLLRTHGLMIEIDGEDSPALVAEWLTLAVFEG
ncbi:MAG: MaoC family dehydratase [Paracoccaceae bacterium]